VVLQKDEGGGSSGGGERKKKKRGGGGSGGSSGGSSGGGGLPEPGSPAARRDIEQRVGNIQERQYDVGVENFRELAKDNDVSPKDLGMIIGEAGAPLGPETTPEYEEFQKDFWDEYGEPMSSVEPDQLAMSMESWRVTGNFKYWNSQFLEQVGPEAVMHGVQLPELASAATAQIMQMTFEIFGGEYAAAALYTAGIEDAAQRDATWQVLAEIAGKSIVPTDGRVAMPTQETATASDPTELIARVLQNPESFDQMTPGERMVTIEAAQAALEVQTAMRVDTEADGSLEEQIVQSQDVLMRDEGWKIVLSPEEVTSLESFIANTEKIGKTAGASAFHASSPTSWIKAGASNSETSGWTTDVDVRDVEGAEQFGFELFRSPGGTPTYTFNEEHVKSNFAEHTAVISYIKHLHPNAIIKYGEEGIAGRAFALFDRGTDELSAPFGAGFEDISERLEQIGNSEEERAEMLAESRRINDRIENGEIKSEDLDAAVAKMLELEDHGSNDAGFGAYMDRVRKRSDPAVFGTGFGDSFVNSLQIYPGDSEYGTAHAVGTLIGQTVFDPAWIFGKVVKGARLAKVVPAGATIDKSRIAQGVFNILSVPAEELILKGRGRRILGKIAEGAQQIGDVDVLKTRLFRAGITQDEEVADLIAHAAMEGPEALHQAAVQWMIGTGAKKGVEAAAVPKIVEASTALRMVDDALPKDLRRLRDAISKTDNIQDGATGVVRARDLVPLMRSPERAKNLAGRTDESMTGLRNSLATKGYDEAHVPDNTLSGVPVGKIEIWVNRNTGEAIIPEGHHRVGISSDLDIEVPVIIKMVDEIQGPVGANIDEVAEAGVSDAMRALSELGAEGLDSPSLFLPKAVVDAIAPEDLRKLRAELETQETLYKKLQGQRSDMLSQKAYWESVMDGSDWSPLHPLGTPRNPLPKPRKINQLTPRMTAWGRLWDDALDVERGLPLRMIRTMDARKLGRYLKQNPKIDEAASRMNDVFRRMGRDTGAGEKLYFNKDHLPEGLLADEAIARTPRALDNFYTNIGTPDDVIDDILTDLFKAVRTGSQHEIYMAFTRGHQRALSTAKRLKAGEKRDLSDMWPELVQDRSPGMVREGAGTSVHSRPTNWVPNVDRLGQMHQSGVPVFDVDMLQDYRLPSMNVMRDYTSQARSTALAWKKAGGTRGKAGGFYIAATGAWRGFNAWWARMVLTGKMPTALPLRIQMEQMLRVEAMGFNSMVRHPIEYWKSLKSLDEFRLFNESPSYAQGIRMTDALDDPIRKLARDGRTNITLEDPGATKALAGRMKQWSASPSRKYFVPSGKTNEEALKALMESRHWKQYKPQWDWIIDQHRIHKDLINPGEEIDSYQKIFDNMRTEMAQVIGDGPGARKIRDAILSGRMPIDGKDVNLLPAVNRNRKTGRAMTEDGNLFADEMARMRESGEWKPQIYQFPRHWGDYLPPDKQELGNILKWASDRLFEFSYARPDAYFGRSPLYRQMAAREFSRLKKLGWDDDRAKAAAEIYGARGVADILFTIGANTSADHFIRSASPFFPAWKELAETWLVKIPSDLGGGGFTGWMVSAPALVNRFDAWTDFFKDTGILYNDAGNWRVKMGFMTPMIKAFTGLDVDTASTSLESLGGVLPLPTIDVDGELPIWHGLMPKIGAPPARVLHELNEKWDGPFKIFEHLEDKLTLFGGNQSLAPASFDAIYYALTGDTPYWLNGTTEDMYRAQTTSALIDALRLEVAEQRGSEPKREDFEKQGQFTEAYADWIEGVVSEAEGKSRRWYFLRGVLGQLSPMSIRPDDDAKAEMAEIYRMIYQEDDPELEAALQSPLLEGFRTAHPDLEHYLTGKSLLVAPDNPDADSSIEEYNRQILAGERLQLSPEEMTVWMLGNQQRAIYYDKVGKIYNEFGDTPQQWLLSDSDISDRFSEAQDEWDRYLDMTVEMGRNLDLKDRAGNPTNFKDMWETYEEEATARYGDQKEKSISREAQMARDTMEGLDALVEHFSPNGYTTDEYFNIRGKLSDAADWTTENSKDPAQRAVAWYWKNYGGKYSDEKEKVWAEINRTESQDKGPLYQKLQEIENRYARMKIVHPKFGKMPSPQEVSFARLTHKSQQVQVMGWAKLPPEFLSTFQRQQTYGNEKPAVTKKMNTLVERINENETEFYRIKDARMLSESSNDYEDLRLAFDRKNLEAAKDLGVLKQYSKWKELPYQRINDSNVIKSPWWDHLIEKVEAGRRAVEATPNYFGDPTSPRGETGPAVEYQQRVIDLVKKYRKDNPKFDESMKQLEIAFGEGADRPLVRNDLYWILFFDGYGPTPSYWD
jgi:hypothetical protein